MGTKCFSIHQSGNADATRATTKNMFKSYQTPNRCFQVNKVKFMYSKKATKIDEIFNFDLMLCSKSQINGKDFPNYRGLLRK